MFKQSACQMVTQLKSGTTSPTEAVQAAFERIEDVEPHVRALPTLCKDRALAAASALENNASLCDARRNDPNWLAGLPHRNQGPHRCGRGTHNVWLAHIFR